LEEATSLREELQWLQALRAPAHEIDPQWREKAVRLLDSVNQAEVRLAVLKNLSDGPISRFLLNWFGPAEGDLRFAKQLEGMSKGVISLREFLKEMFQLPSASDAPYRLTTQEVPKLPDKSS
jgi:hypothetical protein